MSFWNGPVLWDMLIFREGKVEIPFPKIKAFEASYAPANDMAETHTVASILSLTSCSAKKPAGRKSCSFRQSAPENGRLEDYFPLGTAIFEGRAVKLQVGIMEFTKKDVLQSFTLWIFWRIENLFIPSSNNQKFQQIKEAQARPPQKNDSSIFAE